MPGRSTQRGLALVWWLVGLLAAGTLLFALHVWIMLSWSYSSGERAGWVQKLSKKGYLCKTWEGEMAMVSLPGSVPEKFLFTVWDDRTAEEINQLIGRRVALHYEEHIWLPTSCFGETRHFVQRVKLIEETPAPLDIRSTPGSRPPARPAPQDEQSTSPFEEPAPDWQEEAAAETSTPPPPRRPRPSPPSDVPET
jgi:hypothetical protein